MMTTFHFDSTFQLGSLVWPLSYLLSGLFLLIGFFCNMVAYDTLYTLGPSAERKPYQYAGEIATSYNTSLIRAGLSSASFIDATCVSIALSILLHSWWVLGGGLLVALLLIGVTAVSIEKDKSASSQTIMLVSAWLLFPIAWGYVGWLCGLFMFSPIHFLFLPQVLAIIGLVAGFFGHLTAAAIATGKEFYSRKVQRNSDSKW